MGLVFMQKATPTFLCLSKRGGRRLPKNMETCKMCESNAKQACFCLTLVAD